MTVSAGVHQTVLLQEVVDLLALKPGGVCIDGTLGGGGHALELARRVGPQGRLLGIDRDVEALARAGKRLGDSGVLCSLDLVHGNFSDLRAIAHARGITSADGIVLDLGVSSDQLETQERGFSFQSDGPLDMRMDRSAAVTAADLVNGLSEAELAQIFWEFGEEPASRRIARALVQARERDGQIRTTGQLASRVERAMGGRRGRIHPATRVFQALRIRVNDELDALEQGLAAGLDLLAPGGRMAVISFHSLEDRRVKHFFVRHIAQRESLAAGGERWTWEAPRVTWVNRKPVTASPDELEGNPRARSAKLRVAERWAA